LNPAIIRRSVVFPQPDGPSSVKNSPCRISARPEQLRFADEGIPGTIELSTFLGDFIEYEVKLRDGQTVQLNEYTKDVGDIKPDGRQVFVNFDPARISIYAGESEVLSC